MISRILNSRITWWVAPAVSALAVYGAGLRGIYPIPAEESARLVERLRENMAKDPVVPWERVQDDTTRDEFFSRNLVGWRAKPEMLLGLYDMAPEAVESRMTSATETVVSELSTTGPVRENAYRSAQPEIVYGARALAAANRNEANNAGQNLESMLRLETNALPSYLGDFSIYPEAYRKCVPVVAAAESSETLLAIDKVIGRTWMQPDKIRPQLYNSYVAYRFSRYHRENIELQVLYSITRRTHLLTDQFLSADSGRSAGMRNESDYGSLGPLTWTRGLFMLKDGLNRLRDVSHEWKGSLPNFYLNGLSEREKLYAAALLLESPKEVKRKATTRRLAATYRELIRSMIYTKVYRERFGVYPDGLDDLQKVGYLAPLADPTGRSANPDSPMGPLEMAHVVPSAEDFERWFGTSYDVSIESAEEMDGGARTRWVLRLDAGEYQREAFDLAMEIKSLEQQGDVEATSWTLVTKEVRRDSESTETMRTTETVVLWKPTDYELLQHWSYLEARDLSGQFYITPRDRETTGPDDLPPGKAMLRDVEGAIVELVTPSRFVKLSAPQIGRLPEDSFSVAYLLRLLTVYVPEE